MSIATVHAVRVAGRGATPGRGAIMGRRRSAATHSATLESVEAAEQWQRHEIQKEGARELGGLYRQLLEAL